jgi:hypothetical protein
MPEYSYVDLLIDVNGCLRKAEAKDHIYLMSRLLSDHLSQRYTDDASFNENLGIAIGYMLGEREAFLGRISRFEELKNMIKDLEAENGDDWFSADEG